MTRRLFGTDGIRGTANIEPMTPETALKVAMAVGECFHNGAHKHLVIIGKDTRLSGYMLEPALTAGFITMGMDVVLVGPLPTPAIAMLTRSLRADIGVVISASHNPYGDNGIKLFGRDGYKLSDELERRIEECLDKGPAHRAATGELGRAKRLDDAGGRYIEFVKQSFPKGLRLDGLRVVVDCAHGAAYKVAPTVFWELGAEVFSIGVLPDGTNINRDCGALSPEAMRQEVLARRADIGIALDGDADRLIVVDERGVILDGDQLMGLIATSLARENQLAGGALVATVMSNLGLERFLGEQGIGMHRTAVGDRYVVEQMRRSGCNVGGEQSGHIILSDYATTGDGLIAALQVMARIVETGRKASEVCRLFTPAPQLLRNVRFGEGAPLETVRVKRAITAAEAHLGTAGRLVIRASGTEPVIRVMAQGEDENLLTQVVGDVCEAILAASQSAEDAGAGSPGGGVNGRILIVAGSDSGGGAGIQADIKTVTMLGAFATTAITALTAQNTEGVHGVLPIDPAFIRQQMEVVLDDLGADAVKTGMLHDAAVIESVAAVLEERAVTLPLVLDPVMVAKGGAPLIENSAIETLKRRLIPRAAVLTPNLPEAEILGGRKIGDLASMRDAARALLELGCRAVLLKGGHLAGDTVHDLLATAAGIREWQSPRIDSRHTHGTGCTLASAVAAGLAQGMTVEDAVERAREYVQRAIASAPGFGRGHGPLDHAHPLRAI